MQSEDWKSAATALLRIEMARRGVTFKQLSRRLEPLGVELGNVQLSTKVGRGTFSFVFFLQCMRALDVEVVRLFDNQVDALKMRKKR